MSAAHRQPRCRAVNCARPPALLNGCAMMMVVVVMVAVVVVGGVVGVMVMIMSVMSMAYGPFRRVLLRKGPSTVFP